MVDSEQRIARYDYELKIEAQHFDGIMQKFPNHFHEYYVIGFIESGRRNLTCKNQDYIIDSGDLLIFNPLDNHACEQTDNTRLDWKSININNEVMRDTVLQITGRDFLPKFTTSVAYHSEVVFLLRELHEMIMEGRKDFEKEEVFLFLIEQLISEYTEPKKDNLLETSDDIQKCCVYVEQHYADSITLDQLSQMVYLNKYTLVRNFTKQRGMTPYQYLVAVRVGKAKRILETGVEPLTTALETGFSDQSHFTKFFKKLIGLTPKQYKDIFDKK